MDKEYDIGNDIKSDILNDYSDNNKADFGGDLSEKNGIDLNKAMDMAPPPENMHIPNLNNDYAIYTDAPEHVGRSPEQLVADMLTSLEDGDPAPDNRGIAEQEPREPEYSDNDE